MAFDVTAHDSCMCLAVTSEKLGRRVPLVPMVVAPMLLPSSPGHTQRFSSAQNCSHLASVYGRHFNDGTELAQNHFVRHVQLLHVLKVFHLSFHTSC